MESKSVKSKLNLFFQSLKQNKIILMIFFGGIFHISYMIYVLGTDIIRILSYAEMSVALPLGILITLFCIYSLALTNIKRRSARLFLLIMAVLYLTLSIGLPWLDSLFNIGRMMVPSIWLVRWQTTAIFPIISWLGIIANLSSIVGLILYELKGENSFFDKIKVAKWNKRTGFKHFGTLYFFITLIIGSSLITGNQMWFRWTYSLKYNRDYDGDGNFDMGIEYWLGVDEQEYNGTFPVISPIGAILENDDVVIDISSLYLLEDPVFCVRFLINYTHHLYDNLGEWYYLSDDFKTLYIKEVSLSTANFLNNIIVSQNINITCVGYNQTRLEALKAMRTIIVLAGGLGIQVPRGIANDNPEFNATCWLYYNWDIKIQAPHGCGIGFLKDFEMLKAEILQWQETRALGPYYYREVIEGAMYNVEKIDQATRTPLIESYIDQFFPFKISTDEDTFSEWFWQWNNLTQEEYFDFLETWNEFIDLMYQGSIDGTPDTIDPTLRFKFINCGIPENLIDYFDGDPDYAVYYQNLGYGTHWAVDGYMVYRGADEPYWTYGYVNLLTKKPKVVEHEDRMVFLGCMNTNPYRYDFELERGSWFKLEETSEWIRDVNGDCLANGFDVLMLDIMMCGAKGIRKVNLWPGPGPRSPTCCDYKQFARDLMPNGDFFVEMYKVLNRSYEIQFQFMPGEEHFWDKELVDIEMNLLHTKSLMIFGWIFGFYSLFSYILIQNTKKIQKYSRNMQ